AIFYADEEQKRVADRYIAQLESARAFRARIVTEVTPLQGFFRAEDYHQDYATLHPTSGYIIAFDLPKIANLKSMFPALYRAEPRLVKQGG
ncbi:MAG: peptide-methionine (S)-S-oxide reductase, partial [Lautropia sp.]